MEETVENEDIGKDVQIMKYEVSQFLDWMANTHNLLESMVHDVGFLPYSYQYYLKIRMEVKK